MKVKQFSQSLCELNNVIDKYLIAIRSMDCIKLNYQAFHFSDEVSNFIEDVIDEKLKAYEKQIIEQSLKLTQEKVE